MCFIFLFFFHILNTFYIISKTLWIFSYGDIEIFFFLINVCWFCFGGNELSWTWIANCVLIGSSAVQVFSFLVHYLWLFSMHTLFGGWARVMGRLVFWGSSLVFCLSLKFQHYICQCKKEKPRLDGFPRQKAMVFSNTAPFRLPAVWPQAKSCENGK